MWLKANPQSPCMRITASQKGTASAPSGRFRPRPTQYAPQGQEGRPVIWGGPRKIELGGSRERGGILGVRWMSSWNARLGLSTHLTLQGPYSSGLQRSSAGSPAWGLWRFTSCYQTGSRTQYHCFLTFPLPSQILSPLSLFTEQNKPVWKLKGGFLTRLCKYRFTHENFYGAFICIHNPGTMTSSWGHFLIRPFNLVQNGWYFRHIPKPAGPIQGCF